MITTTYAVAEPPLARSATGMLLVLAAAAGAAYAWSPLSVIFAVAMFLLFRRAALGLAGTERRWVLGILIAALLCRSLALAAIYARTNPWTESFHALFGDGRYSIQRSLWILNDWQDVPIGPLYRLGIFASYGGRAYDRCLAAVQWFLGPSPYGLTLISVAAFFGATVLLYRLVRRSFGPAASLAGMLVLLFWPTFFVWSISMLKESVQFFLAAVCVSAAVSIVRQPHWRTRAVLIALVAAAAVLIAPLRIGSDLIVLGAVFFGYAVFASTRRAAVAVLLVLCVAAGGAVLARQAAVQTRVQEGVSYAMRNHIGHVMTPGKSYHAADQRFYSERFHRGPRVAARPVSFEEGARFLLKSAVMFVLVPLPSQNVSASELAFLPQHMAWYVLLALAGVGAWIGFRRDPLLTATCVGYCLAAMAVIAPNSGNIGTLIRHRDSLVPFVVWLSGLGAVGVLHAMNRNRHASD